MTEDIFRVKWDTGYIETLVSSFFVEANVPRIKKLFKLAQQHCTEKQKTELLAALACADKERENLLNALGELAYKKNQCWRISSTRPNVCLCPSRAGLRNGQAESGCGSSERWNCSKKLKGGACDVPPEHRP